MNSFKPIWMTFATAVLLSLASCSTSPPVPDNTQVSSGAAVETKSPKIYIRHFGPFGPQFHLIDVWLYDDIVRTILEHGGDPTPENIDKVYDGMRH
jgi:hypothetical protein